MKKKAFRYIGALLLLFLCYVIVVLAHGTITDYQPKDELPLPLHTSTNSLDSIDSDTLSAFTWNLGYAGLSAECNFFYPKQGILRSNGKMVRPDKAIVDKNMSGILQTLKDNPSDFYLLQEVDSLSKRNYFCPMLGKIRDQLKGHSSSFAVNYKVERVPTPILEPWNTYGQTLSGLATCSRFQCVENKRYQLPGKFSWPNSIFLLDRCLAVHRIPTTWGPNLYLVNLHNSAYDSDGSIKKEQMEFLKELIVPWYEAGDYVIVGGDWNQPPPYFNSQIFNKNKNLIPRKPNNIPADYLSGDWKFIFDPTVPTIRSNSEIYDAERTPTGLIDYFLISPNVNALAVRGIDTKFAYSDHQPVKMEFALLRGLGSK